MTLVSSPHPTRRRVQIVPRDYRRRRGRMVDLITFIDDATGKPKRALVQVKSGHVKSGDIRDLRGTVQREGAALGVFITLETPSRDMLTEAASAGFYRSPGWGKDYPDVQVVTVAELLRGAEVKMPPAHGTFKQAQRADQSTAEQHGLDL